MTPKEVLEKWIDCFNASDVEGIAALYADDAVNHQVANAPVAGKEAIRRMFAGEFATAKMVCIVENIFDVFHRKAARRGDPRIQPSERTGGADSERSRQSGGYHHRRRVHCPAAEL